MSTDEMHLLLLDYRRQLEGVARHIPRLPSLVEREAALAAYQNVCQQVMALIEATGGLRRKQENADELAAKVVELGGVAGLKAAIDAMNNLLEFMQFEWHGKPRLEHELLVLNDAYSRAVALKP